MCNIDEWYKAAYYKSDGSGYSLYANGLDTIPPADDGWNYVGGEYASPWDTGTGELEQNGTYDMMGNVWEWNETLVQQWDGTELYSYRGIRGGSYYGNNLISAYHRYYVSPDDESTPFGFRVASIPEPGTLLFIFFGGLALGIKRT